MNKFNKRQVEVEIRYVVGYVMLVLYVQLISGTVIDFLAYMYLVVCKTALSILWEEHTTSHLACVCHGSDMT